MVQLLLIATFVVLFLRETLARPVFAGLPALAVAGLYLGGLLLIVVLSSAVVWWQGRRLDRLGSRSAVRTADGAVLAPRVVPGRGRATGRDGPGAHDDAGGAAARVEHPAAGHGPAPRDAGGHVHAPRGAGARAPGVGHARDDDQRRRDGLRGPLPLHPADRCALGIAAAGAG